MTQQYIVGEFSSLLAELQPAPGQLLASAVDDLRREVEIGPRTQLPWLAQEALILADTICWNALDQGDAKGFCRYAGTAVALRDFTVSANLLP
jgi:hypothetical protein